MQIIVEEANRLNNVVTRFLDYARAERPGGEGADKWIADKAFATADRVVSLTLVNNRLVTNYLEPRACVHGDRLTEG